MSRITTPALCAAFLAVLLIPARLPAGDLQVDGKLISTAEAGTPPLEVSSPDRVENLNADMVDGMHAGSFRFHDVIRVGKNGTGDFESIQAAIDSLGPNNPRAMLISVGPGVYRERVVLGPHVHLQGAGTGLTVIESTGSNSFDSTAAVVVLRHLNRVSDLTVRPLDTNSFTIGLYHTDGFAEIHDVKVSYVGSSLAAIGVYNTTTATLEIQDSRIGMLSHDDATYTAALWNGNVARVRRCVVTVDGPDSATSIGFVNTGGAGPWSLHIEGSDLDAAEVLADDSNPWFTVIRHSKVVGSLLGNVDCQGVTTSATFFANDCPPEL